MMKFRKRSNFFSIHKLCLWLSLFCCFSLQARALQPVETHAVNSQVASLSLPSLAAQIDEILAHKALKNAQLSIALIHTRTGQLLYDKNANLALNPASNIKLVTTAAALALLGPEHYYVTRVFGKRKAKSIQGDIYLKGGGDPSLVTENLYWLAGQLRAQGITRITGGVSVDSSAFDRDEFPPEFTQKQDIAAYRAPSGATSVNFNTYTLHINPVIESEGAPYVLLEPAIGSIKIDNQATLAEGIHNRLVIEHIRKNQQTIVKISGSLGKKAAPAIYRWPIENPSQYAGEVFRLVLKQHGIRLGRTAIRLTTTPHQLEQLAIYRSPPLSVLIRSINKLSNNFMAEQVLKSLSNNGDPASFKNALTQVSDYMTAIGMPMTDFHMSNGSGLYDASRMSAAQLTYLLRHVYQDIRFRSEFMASLPIAGVDGTLHRRFDESPINRYIRAKTGTLDQVSSLSGYIGTEGEDPLAFAILINGFERWNIHQVRALQTQIVELVALHFNPSLQPTLATAP